MAESLSRRTFLGFAAVLGGVGSAFGLGRVAGAEASPTPIPKPKVAPDLHRNPPAGLHDWSIMCLKLHKHFSKEKHPEYKIVGPRSFDLGNDATSFRFSAELVNNVAENTLHVRDHIRRCEPIQDQTAWPTPKPIEPIPDAPSGSIDSLTTGILRWLNIEQRLFDGILSAYGTNFENLVPGDDDTDPRPFFHDELHRMASNAVDFIQFENEKWANDQHFVFEKPPTPPAASSEPDTVENKNLWLIKLEWGFHRLVQAHMEIGSFIPAHLTLAAARACNSLDGRAFIK